MKCLKLVLVYRIFYKNKPSTARNKSLRTYVDSKAITLKPWKRNYYSVIRKSLDWKFEYTFLKNNFTRTQLLVFLFYHYFYPGIFMFGIYLVSSSLLRNQFGKITISLFDSQCFLHSNKENLILSPRFSS